MNDGRNNRIADAGLAVAVSIADYLVATRFAFGGRSTWLATTAHTDANGNTRLGHGTVGPTIYGGTAGIGLFLAEVGSRTRSQKISEAAVEAVSHALSRRGSIHLRLRLGFFTGVVGIAYAAHRVGHLVDRPDLIRRASAIIRSLARPRLRTALLDVISGPAGSAPAIASMVEDLGNSVSGKLARRLGRLIAQRATRNRRGWSWGSGATGFESARNLTGFAHGTAGFAWSLAELYRHFGDPLFLRGVRGAVRYENGWFRPDQSNWPDFRETPTAASAPCRTAWCHGAPGIGMSRLALRGLVTPAQCDVDIRAAMHASLRVLEASGGRSGADFTLCHGLSGILEFLLLAGDALPTERGGPLASEAALSFAEEYLAAPERWPCGLSRGTNPSLMVGLAGIGYFYLKLVDPSVPSLLLPSTRSRAYGVSRLTASRASRTNV